MVQHSFERVWMPLHAGDSAAAPTGRHEGTLHSQQDDTVMAIHGHSKGKLLGMRTWSTFWNVKHAPLHAFLPLGLSQVGGANRVILQLTDTCFKADAGGFCHSCPLGTWRSTVISSWSAGGWCIWDGKAAEQMRRTDRGELRVSWRSESYHNHS